VQDVPLPVEFLPACVGAEFAVDPLDDKRLAAGIASDFGVVIGVQRQFETLRW
jgi:hypothetical protein